MYVQCPVLQNIFPVTFALLGVPEKQGCKKGKIFPGFGANKSVSAFSYCLQAHNHMQLQWIKIFISPVLIHLY